MAIKEWGEGKMQLHRLTKNDLRRVVRDELAALVKRQRAQRWKRRGGAVAGGRAA